MAPLNDEIREILVQSRAERQALFEPVSELSRRLQPRHLVEVTTQYAKRRVSDVVGGVSDAIRENGGTAAAVALGAVAIFDAGRRSAHADTTFSGTAAAEPETLANSGHLDTASIRYPGAVWQGVSNLSRAKVLVGSAAGLLVGHAIGRAFPPTGKEQELLGKAAGEIQTAASGFINEHSHGAKVAAAQAFGFARYSAAFLAVMASISEYFGRSEGGNPPTH